VLEGVSVLVAGAGLAGLVAARDLVALGAAVTVVEARDRVGGRVWTVRQGFTDGQYGEAGAEMIDETHEELIHLVRALGLTLRPMLRRGWALARPDAKGRIRLQALSNRNGWARLAKALTDHCQRYRLAERRWDSPIAAELARQSVAKWLEDTQADSELRDTAVGMRGFFLADPEDLSLLALVDQFATDEIMTDGALALPRMFRVDGGNDRVATSLASALGERVRLSTELVALSQRGRSVRASVRHKRQAYQISCDYAICALPATLLRRVPMTPALPAAQHEAIASLSYGRVTKSLLQFSSGFWRGPGQPSAFGSRLEFGAGWDGSEGQRGKAAILTVVAGGSAGTATAELIGRDGSAALARQLEWFGSNRAQLIAAHHTSWDQDLWARGGYAYFDPGFDPALRAWLARPFERIFFAGEHTSVPWQGYMNGAVESGRRAAAEVDAAHRLGRPA
jgi:monoamine oxidase